MLAIAASAGSAAPAAGDAHAQQRDVALLTGREAGDVLEVAVAAAGGSLVTWRTRQVHASGRGATACYRAVVRWPDGVRDETLAACTGDVPDAALLVERDGDRVGVWRFPHDPDLPGLAAASDERRVADLLATFGCEPGPIRLVQRAYRPRRRAVIEAIGARGRVFVKAVRPDRAQRIHEHHRLLAAHGVPVPQSLGWTTDGLVVLQALGGRTLRDAVRLPIALPDGADVVELLAALDRLPADLATEPRRRSWLDKVDHYAAAVGTIVPAEAARVDRLARTITAEAGTGAATVVHGDFYESQLLVDGGRIRGLLDIDTLQTGDRLDDLGCLLGHLSVLARLEPAHARRINELGSRYVAAFDRHVDAADLRYRAAAVVVSLATGPHRVLQPGWPAITTELVDLAARWVSSARRARDGRGT